MKTINLDGGRHCSGSWKMSATTFWKLPQNIRRRSNECHCVGFLKVIYDVLSSLKTYTYSHARSIRVYAYPRTCTNTQIGAGICAVFTADKLATGHANYLLD